MLHRPKITFMPCTPQNFHAKPGGHVGVGRCGTTSGQKSQPKPTLVGRDDKSPLPDRFAGWEPAFKWYNCQKPKKPAEADSNWSGRQDSNLRPPGPKPGALPACATSRMPFYRLGYFCFATKAANHAQHHFTHLLVPGIKCVVLGTFQPSHFLGQLHQRNTSVYVAAGKR